MILHCSRSSRFIEVICSMKNLETLQISYDYYLTPEDLARVFQSCSKLIKLDTNFGRKTREIAEHLKNQMRGRRRHWIFFFKTWNFFREMELVHTIAKLPVSR